MSSIIEGTEKETRTTLGIIGFGRFGTLFAKILADDFSVLIYDKEADKDDEKKKALIKEATSIGAKLASKSEVASCENVVLCVPILGFEEALREYRQYFSKGATIIDVLSVKKNPLKLMTAIVPDDIEILLTHPMFGPDAVKEKGLKNQPIVICPEQTSQSIVSFWHGYFERKGLKVVEMSCEEHDRITAYSLCLTQLLGRAVDQIDIVASDMDTEDFENLLKIREHACNDSLELFRGLQQMNPFAKKMRVDLMKALRELERSLEDV